MSEIDALLELSTAAHRSGNFAVAAQGYAAILSVKQDSPQVWHQSGRLAHQMGRSVDGANYILQSLALDPNAERQADLAEIYLSLDAHEAAEEYAAAALAIDPDAAAAHYCLGVARARQGRLHDALPSLQKSVEARHRLDSTLLETGLARQAIGDVDGAVESFSALVQQYPQQPAGYFHLSRFLATGRYQFSAQQISQVRSLLTRQEQNSVSAAWLHFTLGLHFETTENFDESFKHYQRANDVENHRLKETASANSLSGLRQVVDRLIRFFDKDRITSLSGVGDPACRPVFVVGLPRSGTTLCAQVLASHPDIANVGEAHALGEALQPLTPCWDTNAPSTSLDQELFRNAASQYLSSVASINADAKFTVDKLPDNAMYIGFIHTLFPQAAIVHCRRDPRDVAISNFSVAFQSERLRWETSTLEIIAETIRQKTRLSRHWKKVLPGRVTEVFYESFVQHPERETRRILACMHLDWADACRHPERQPTIVGSASSIQIRNPIYRSSCARWKRFECQLAPVLEMLQSEIAEYESDLVAAMAAQK